MARLPRKNNKVFCENAQQADVGQFGSLNAGTKVETTDIDSIQSLSAWGDGWKPASLGDNCYPTLQERNGLDYVQSYLLNYLYQEGIAEWSANTTYYKGSIVKLINGTNIILYQSLIDNNTAALSDTNSWKEWDYANSDLSNLSALGQTILDKKVEVEALFQQNGYAKFSWKENNVISKIIFIFLKDNFDSISVPANSSITKVLNLPLIIEPTSLNWVAIANVSSIFCTTISVTNSTIECRLNNTSNSAKTVSRVNLIAIAFEN